MKLTYRHSLQNINKSLDLKKRGEYFKYYYDKNLGYYYKLYEIDHDRSAESREIKVRECGVYYKKSDICEYVNNLE